MDRLNGETQQTAEAPRTAENLKDQLGELGAMIEPQGPEQSGIREYARVLWRRKLVVVIVVVVAVGGVLGYCKLAGKTYTATATILLEPPISSLVTQAGASNPNAALVNVADQIQVIESSSIANIVARTIPNPPSATAAQIGLLATDDTVTLSVSSSDPQTAAAAANAYAQAYINNGRATTKKTFDSAQAQLQNKVDTVQLAIANLTNQIRATPAGVNTTVDVEQLGNLENELTNLLDTLQQYQFYATQGTSTEVGKVISAATPPTSPSSPKTLEYTVLALIFGIIAGIGLALLVNAVSTRD